LYKCATTVIAIAAVLMASNRVRFNIVALLVVGQLIANCRAS